MLKIGDEISLVIKSLSSTGSGVGFYEADTPRAVFVPLSVPGDTLKVKIVNQKKVYFEGEIVSIIKESHHRVKSVCSHFGICGACDYLNIDYDKQVEEKKNLLEFLMSKSGFDDLEIKTIKAKNPLNYRDKARFAKGGFYARKSNTIIKIKECPLMNPAYDDLIRSGEADGSYGFDYKTKKITKDIAFYSVGKHEFKYDPSGFVQNNLGMNEVLVDGVVSLAGSGKNLLDLYCGNGNFTIPLSFNFGRVDAIEGSKKSYSLLLENIKISNAANIKPYNDDSKDFVKRKRKYDCIVLDPPRAGSDEVLRDIAEQTKKIIYVSCDPIVLAKELKDLKKTKEFMIEKIILIDMFPQTRHFETIAFIKVSSGKI